MFPLDCYRAGARPFSPPGTIPCLRLSVVAVAPPPVLRPQLFPSASLGSLPLLRLFSLVFAGDFSPLSSVRRLWSLLGTMRSTFGLFLRFRRPSPPFADPFNDLIESLLDQVCWSPPSLRFSLVLNARPTLVLELAVGCVIL